MTNAPADTSASLSASTNVVRLRRPQVAAHSNEERLRRSRELGGAYPYEMDFSTHTLIAAPGLGTLFGLGEEDAITYDNVVARIHPDDRPRVKAAHQHALRTGGAYEQEYRVVLRDGSTRWLMARGEVLHDELGQAKGLGGILIDITRRKQAEIALAESEEFTRRLLASSTDCIKVLDFEARLRFMSEGGMRVMEVDDFSRIEGCRWTDFWEGPEAEDARAAVEAAKAGGTGRFRGFCPTVAGTPRWWDVVVTAIKGVDGRPERLLSISRDVTEPKHVEDALRQSQERLNLALTAAQIGTWVWDIPAGQIVADERLARMFSVDPERAAQGAPVEEYLAAVHPEDRDNATALMARVMKCGGEASIEHRIIKDGATRWISARGYCELDEQGRPSRFPAATVDITDLKQAVEARELLARELSHRIKNIFTVVQGLVAMSARTDEAARPFARALQARLSALAQAHEYVRPHSPASQPTERERTIFGLLRLLLAPYAAADRERFCLEGEDVAIGESTATALALILHEQATNAVKYGALASDEGRVRISGSRRGDAYHLTWEERGGPTVTGSPERQGFGTVLAARSITGQLGGDLRHDWQPEGLIMHMSVPVESLAR
jgi:PAS domain S-box-containing protein